MGDFTGTIPLCYPNNFTWNKHSNELLPNDEEERETLKLNQEALDTLAEFKDPIAVIGICGSARSGKSYILSQLQDGVDFELGHSMTSKTTGIWMPRKLKIMNADGRRLGLLLLDTEGLGAVDTTDDQQNDKWDNQIFTLSTLASSLLIYNSQNVPNANDLEKLNFIANLSESVFANGKNGEEEYASLASFRMYSPDLFWIVRDLTLQPLDKTGKECDVRTYLLDKVLCMEECNRYSKVRSKQNAIRRNIREMFRTIDGYGLPIPSTEPTVIQNMNHPNYKSALNPKFISGVDELKNRLLNIVQPKRMAGASFLTGATLVQLLETYVIAINEKGCVPEWSTAWENVVKSRTDHALNAAIEEYRRCMQSVLQKLPLENLLGEHDKARKKACELFSEETKMTTSLTNEHIERLMNACAKFDADTHACVGGIFKEIADKNDEASEKHCEELCLKLKQEHIDPILKNETAPNFLEYLLVAIEKVYKKYGKGAVGPRKSVVQNKYTIEFNQILKEAASKNEELQKKEIMERMQKQAEADKIVAQNDTLVNNLKISVEQYKHQLSMMEKQQQNAEEELRRLTADQTEDRQRLLEMMKNMKESHTDTVKALLKAQEDQVEILADQGNSVKEALVGEGERLQKMILEKEKEIARLKTEQPRDELNRGKWCKVL